RSARTSCLVPKARTLSDCTFPNRPSLTIAARTLVPPRSTPTRVLVRFVIILSVVNLVRAVKRLQLFQEQTISTCTVTNHGRSSRGSADLSWIVLAGPGDVHFRNHVV